MNAQQGDDWTVDRNEGCFTDYGRAREGHTDFIPAGERAFSLALITTEDGFSEKVKRKMQLFKDVSDVYHERFHSQSILFTKTPQLFSFFANSSVIVSSDFAYGNTSYVNSSVNPFGMPVITSLFQNAGKRIRAEYYGYLNSDILIEPTLFDLLAFCKKESEAGRIAKRVSIPSCRND